MQLLAAVIVGAVCLDAQSVTDYRQDFGTAISRIAASYAYFDTKATRWADIPSLYAGELAGVKNRDDFVTLLEHVVDELYDPHAQLTVNLAHSPRLVPSGTDLWAEWRDGRAVITQVRDGSDAQRAGLTAGVVVVAIDGVRIADAVERRLGRSYPHSVAAARDWGLRAVLAGRHETPRVLQIEERNATRTVDLPAADQFGPGRPPLDMSQLRPGIGYIRFNDSLGDGATVADFDRALDSFGRSRGLIVDLRDTPSGGNSSVARGILGRFVDREQPYQKHVLPSEERDMGVRRSWLELVSPRGAVVHRRQVAVLVGRWTGSMGEGLAIGFDATRSGRVIGTSMAGLVGATMSVTLPQTGIGINVPAEQLYHVSGTPREQFQPSVIVDASHDRAGHDVFVDAAIAALGAR